MAHCRQLITQKQANEVATRTPVIAPAATPPDKEQEPASDDFEEAEVPRAAGCCRTCQGELELLGRLKGTETKAMQSLAQAIVFRMLSFFTEVAEVGYAELLSQLRIAWLRPQLLPQPIRQLLLGRARLTPIECGALEALVIEELERRSITSGIPPPMQQRPSAQRELHHVA